MGDYGGYRGIIEEVREIERKERQEKLVDCPVCGEPLQWRNGIANCPAGHYRASNPTKGGIA
jgi:hypothetical protein